MTGQSSLLDKRIVVIASLMSVIVSAAYACSFGRSPMHPLCHQIGLVGLPGILIAAVVSIALLGSHGGGSLGMLLVIATPVNFLVYFGLAVAMKKVVRLVCGPDRFVPK